MSKADYKIEGTVPRELLVSEVRKAARQFAMQFFHFSKYYMTSSDWRRPKIS